MTLEDKGWAEKKQEAWRGAALGGWGRKWTPGPSKVGAVGEARPRRMRKHASRETMFRNRYFGFVHLLPGREEVNLHTHTHTHTHGAR